MKKEGLINVMYELEVKDEKGKIIEKRKGKAKTFTLNFMQWLYQHFTRTIRSIGTLATLVERDGTTKLYPLSGSADAFYYGAFGSDLPEDQAGIHVGSGSNPYNPNDYKLQNEIPHGSASGQLVHDVTYATAPEILTDRIKFTFYRSFTNNSGADISVQEIGIYMFFVPQGYGGYYALMERTVLSSPITVPYGKVLTVRYIFWIAI